MKRYRRTFRRGSKRSVSWLPGQIASNLGQTDRSVTNLISTPGASGGCAFLALVTALDLPLHGGEDAVVTRIVGDIHLIGGRGGIPIAPVGGFLHVSILQKEVDSQLATTVEQNMFHFLNQGKDNVLFDCTLWCPALPVGVPLIQPWPISIHIDTGVRRKVQEDNEIFLCFSSAGPIGDSLIDEVTWAGGLRVLLKDPL